MHIGLIGGTGPAATVSYYMRLISAFKGAEIPLELTIVHADVSTLVKNAANDQRQAQAEIFARHIAQLKGAGSDVAVITALTGHFCIEEVEELSELPLVSPIGLIDQYCLEHGIGTLGLLGGPSVLSSRLFGLLQGPEIVIPRNDPDRVGDIYLEIAMSGVCSAANRRALIGAGSAMVQDQRADAVLLAGTDLGLAFDNQDIDYRVIDALEIHVDGLVSLASA